MKITDPLKKTRLLICIDFDEKFIELKAFDSKGNLLSGKGLIVAGTNKPTALEGRLIKSVYKYVNELEHAVKHIVGLAVSCPGVISAKGGDVIFFNANWGEISLGTKLKQEFHIPVMLENSGHAAAWGEKKYGVGVGFDTFIYISVDDSVDGGIILKNKLLHGSTNSAAIFGHTVAKSNGKKCICGNNGCLESYVSVQGIVNTIKKNVKMGKLKLPDSSISSETKLIETVNFLAHNGDAQANSLLREAGRYLGMVLYDSCLLISPNAIIVSGRVFDCSDLILLYMQEYISIALSNIGRYNGKSRHLPLIIKSELDQDSRFLGIANLFLEKMEKGRFEKK